MIKGVAVRVFQLGLILAGLSLWPSRGIGAPIIMLLIAMCFNGQLPERENDE